MDIVLVGLISDLDLVRTELPVVELTREGRGRGRGARA